MRKLLFTLIFIFTASTAWSVPGLVEIWDSQNKAVVDTGGSLVQIGSAHHQGHKGNRFVRCYREKQVASGGNMTILIQTNEATPHSTYLMATGGKAFVSLYEAPTVTSNGTEIIPSNMNRTSSKTAHVQVFHGITTSDNGNFICGHFLPADTGPRSSGTAMSQRVEWVGKENTSYLIVVDNEGGAAEDLYVNLNWYEPGYAGY